jgi:hypothetical protein
LEKWKTAWKIGKKASQPGKNYGKIVVVCLQGSHLNKGFKIRKNNQMQLEVHALLSNRKCNNYAE